MKDQVGNIRMTFTTNGSTAQVLQNDDYYPFGNTFNSSLPSGARNNWLFNGMEWNENTVNTYDFHARMYDPQIGRSFQLDPLGDMFASVSPYSFLMNNPLMYTDPTGMTAETKEETGDGEGYFDDMGPITTLYSGSWFINSGKAYRGAGGFLAAFNPRGQYLRERSRRNWYRYVMVERYKDTYTVNNYEGTMTYQDSKLESRYFVVDNQLYGTLTVDEYGGHIGTQGVGKNSIELAYFNMRAHFISNKNLEGAAWIQLFKNSPNNPFAFDGSGNYPFYTNSDWTKSLFLDSKNNKHIRFEDIPTNRSDEDRYFRANTMLYFQGKIILSIQWGYDYNSKEKCFTPIPYKITYNK